MPELPEIEIIRLGLQKKIIGLKLKNIQLLNPKIFQGQLEDIMGKKVLNVLRRGKILEINLSDNLTLLFHLKMSGQLVFVDRGQRFVGGHPTQDMQLKMPNNSTRVIFEFSDRGKLYFNDQRKFGWIKVIKGSDIDFDKLISTLGPEPLGKNFTWQDLKQRLKGHKNWSIKVALMDQQALAGVGNIYANEACFNAKLDPSKRVGLLSNSDWERLYSGLIGALKSGIRHGGSSRAHFVNAEGKKGLFLDYANVYQRDGEKCKVCGSEIKKITLSNRGTYFCPKCQLK